MLLAGCTQVETLARTVLQAPVEIQVGGRSIVNADITQLVELREEDDRFLRLLEVLPPFFPRLTARRLLISCILPLWGRSDANLDGGTLLQDA
jgi:hypothetical protein